MGNDANVPVGFDLRGGHSAEARSGASVNVMFATADHKSSAESH